MPLAITVDKIDSRYDSVVKLDALEAQASAWPLYEKQGEKLIVTHCRPRDHNRCQSPMVQSCVEGASMHQLVSYIQNACALRLTLHSLSHLWRGTLPILIMSTKHFDPEAMHQMSAVR